jgi:Signal recognition particle 9 kDa protein (SRP9)
MKINDFEEFYKATELMLENSPSTTRYMIKYRGVDGTADLKVTNNEKAFTWRTDQYADLQLIERINVLFLRHSTTQTLSS